MSSRHKHLCTEMSIIAYLVDSFSICTFLVMVFNSTFNNISVISWRSVLLVEKTGVPGENHRLTSHRQTLSHTVVSSAPRLSVIRTDNVSGDRH